MLLVEFWDEEHVFNRGEVSNRVADYLAYPATAAFADWVVMWRGDLPDEFGFMFGARETPPRSWGNVLFIRNKNLALAIEAWARETFGGRRVIRGDGLRDVGGVSQ